MKSISRLCRLAGVAALAVALLGGGSAAAFEAHNYIEPPFGSFGELGGITIDSTTGNVYGTDLEHEHGEHKGEDRGEVKVFGASGGAAADGLAPGFTGSGSPQQHLGPVHHSTITSGLAVDPSTGDAYVSVSGEVDKYELDGEGDYHYSCAIRYFASGGGDRCLANGGSPQESTQPGESIVQGYGTGIDADGNVYTDAQTSDQASLQAVWEFNAAGESVQVLSFPEGATNSEPLLAIAVAPGGTVYALEASGAFSSGQGRVFELARSSLTGPLEGTPTAIPGIEKATGIAFDGANGELFVDFGSYIEAFNAAHEVVSRFGKGQLTSGKGGSIAVNEATGEVYVAELQSHQILRFGPGLLATAPSVDAPPPTAAVTRTTALLSATVDTGNATTTWQVQYAPAGEYAPRASNPYAAGGVTAPSQLAGSAEGDVVSAPIVGLLAGVTYDYRVIATSEAGTTYGPNHTFTTAPATPPIVETGGAQEVTQTGVVLTGTVDTRELQTSYEFEVGTNTAYEGAKLFGNAGNAGTESVSLGLQFLIPGVTYHYRLVATNEDGTTAGQDVTFTTPGTIQPIAQPGAESFVPTPRENFPSDAGTTKPHGAAGKHKKKTRSTRRKGRGRRRRARSKHR